MKRNHNKLMRSSVARANKVDLRVRSRSPSRSDILYGFSNHALKKTPEEIRAAWASAVSCARVSEGGKKHKARLGIWKMIGVVFSRYFKSCVGGK